MSFGHRLHRRRGTFVREHWKVEPFPNVLEQVSHELLLYHTVGEAVKCGAQNEHDARNETPRDALNVVLHAAADVTPELVALLQAKNADKAAIGAGDNQAQGPIEAERGGHKDVGEDENLCW